MDAAADQYAHWTPENIAKDPENYLRFCESEANKVLQSLKASEIAVAQNRASLENTLTEAGNKIGVGEKALGELKAVFTQASAANQWPATWQGRSLDQDAAKRQIVSLHKQVEAQKGLKGKVEQGIKKLDAQVTRIQEGRDQTQGQLAEIKTGREMLKVQKLTEELTTKLSSIKGVLQATINTASETSGPVTLDQLAEQSVGTVDDTEFNAIMGK
jgi:predicted  nucleic acid-binding Zn-ribbon protein